MVGGAAGLSGGGVGGADHGQDVVKLVGSSYRMENRSGSLNKEEGGL